MARFGGSLDREYLLCLEGRDQFHSPAEQVVDERRIHPGLRGDGVGADSAVHQVLHVCPNQFRVHRTRRGGARAAGRVGGLVGDLEQGVVEVCLVEGESEDDLRDEQEDLKVSQVGLGSESHRSRSRAAVARVHTEFLREGAEAVGLGAAPVRRH